MSVTKPTQIRIRIADADMPVIEDLAGNVLSITDVASLLLNAAVHAVKDSGGKLSFPPKFQVSGQDPAALSLAEKPAKYSAKK